MTLALAERWFERRKLDADVTLLWEPHVDPLIRCNIWHIRGRDSDLLVDSGLGICSLREAARDLFEGAVQAVATHSHYDHIGGHHEFEECLAHPLELDLIRNAEEQDFYGLVKEQIPPAWAQAIEGFGYPLPDILVTAVPAKGWDARQYRLRGAGNLRGIDEGDRIDLGDREFEVLHLPGHSPGSIGLWDQRNRVLFAGDAVYDGPLLAEIPGANKADYVRTLEKLLNLPVDIVHAGHEPSFGRERLHEIIHRYLEEWKVD